MKKLFLALFFVPQIFAASLTFQWNHNATNENILLYRLYEHSGPNYLLLGSTTNNTLVINGIIAGPHAYTVTASNIWGESIKGQEVNTPNLPGAPTNTTIINVSAAYQGSTSPQGPWEDIELAPNIIVTPLYSFYRVKTIIQR
jgi:hypothetical protein